MKYEHKLIIRVILLLAIPYFVFYPIFTPLTIYPSYLILKLAGFNPILLSSTKILLSNITLNFIPACIAASAYYLLYLLILLTKDLTLLKSIKLFIYGSLLILIMNIFRIYTVVFILLNYSKNYFDAIHLTFWTIFSSIYVALVWVFLTKKLKIKTIPFYSDAKYLYKKLK
ncbi:MAG: pacearchaeosortase [Candidatus Woesearchaeota archaeon]|nr:MAG: pacearchaeosortase [Candidatus Woesearchaeota archaeon]